MSNALSDDAKVVAGGTFGLGGMNFTLTFHTPERRPYAIWFKRNQKKGKWPIMKPESGS